MVAQPYLLSVVEFWWGLARIKNQSKSALLKIRNSLSPNVRIGLNGLNILHETVNIGNFALRKKIVKINIIVG